MKYDITVSGNIIGGRQGFAYICNSGKFAVLKADVEKEQEYEGFNQFEEVKVERQTRSNNALHAVGTLVCENAKWYITGGGACLHSSFGFSDMTSLVNNAQLPIVKENDIVAVALISKKCDFVWLNLYKVGRVDLNCITMATLTPLTEDEMNAVAKDAERWCDR